ncbi:hypothetical protein CY34DRAFT_812263 [Suillus luteus UH-Slu-Lm8-n1]|uniref:Uncharacterized protein n=1 Tax=Suillus luteus UH-Slu-Lm8-n1 TaxID=930992 RepID=A0A0D0AM29_9AGAM|nr:hypothetical protein CY34DRAFT_812263 [Suillus luteus UH-Slu-Lm8-n1]
MSPILSSLTYYIRRHKPALTLNILILKPIQRTPSNPPPPRSQSRRADGRQFESSCSKRIAVPACMLLKRIDLFLADEYCGWNIDISAVYWDASSVCCTIHWTLRFES